MNSDLIKSIQSKIGTPVDGFWGPKSIAAAQRHLRSLMPSPSPWPAPDTKSLKAFYGQPGDEGNLVFIDVTGLGMKYEGKAITRLRCHRKVADSLKRALTAARAVKPLAIDEFAGVYNFRKKRGGTSYSLHAWGAAIDLEADTNTFRQTWPVSADMPFEVMEAFAREGWIAAGAFWGYDAMHFQATI